jgi:hypothetical protein
MADEIKVAQPLVMTAQLQLAIKLLSMSSKALPVEAWKTEIPGLDELPSGARDPLDVEEEANEPDPGFPPWFPATESPLPALAELPDVWVFGNPPQARANRHAYPRLRATTKDALWLLRALRQRARTYERIVQAVVDARPALGVTLDPAAIQPVSLRSIAEAVAMHESTVERVAQGLRFQNLHLLLGLTKQGKKLGFAKA